MEVLKKCKINSQLYALPRAWNFHTNTRKIIITIIRVCLHGHKREILARIRSVAIHDDNLIFS